MPWSTRDPSSLSRASSKAPLWERVRHSAISALAIDLGMRSKRRDPPPPSRRPRCRHRSEMVRRCGRNMKEFISGWVICLDEPMSSWINHWTCPGWIFCLQKPHPFGNEYHTACCALSGIMFAVGLVEGKDAPPQIKVPHAKSMARQQASSCRCSRRSFGQVNTSCLIQAFAF
jgi:hypothetical protein